MNSFIFYMIILNSLLLSIHTVTSQAIFDARNTGMAYSNTADTRGLQQIGANPATLALPYQSGFELNLFSLNIRIFNNSFNKGLYDQYFTTGDTLNASDKISILNRIPSSGLQGDFRSGLNTFSFYLPNFSLAMTATGDASFNLPKELAEIALNGNADIGRVYDLSSINGHGWAGISVKASLAIPIKKDEDAFINFAAIGFSAQYLTGLAYFETLNSQGRFYNLDDENPTIRLEGELEARMARGGSGRGFDFGIIAQTHSKLTFSMAVLNSFGSIDWKILPEKWHLSIETDSLAISRKGIEDSLIVKNDTTITIDPFKTHLPAILDIGISYQAYSKLVLNAKYNRALTSYMGKSLQKQLAVGVEFSGLPILPIRSGIAFGGKDRLSIAFGTGIDLKIWYLDIGFISHGGIFNKNSQGATLAVTTRFRL